MDARMSHTHVTFRSEGVASGELRIPDLQTDWTPGGQISKTKKQKRNRIPMTDFCPLVVPFFVCTNPWKTINKRRNKSTDNGRILFVFCMFPPQPLDKKTEKQADHRQPIFFLIADLAP